MNIFVTCFLTLAVVKSDTFNYDVSRGTNYGPKEWNRIQCSDVATCPGWPDNWEFWDPRIPYQESPNACVDCSGQNLQGICARHQQSPIPLTRNITAKNKCLDHHKMVFKAGDSARFFLDMNFTLERHVLRAFQPFMSNGSSLCKEPANIDFSMGFPDPWHLVFTDIKVPSEHTQDGKQYDAEVILSHEYSYKRKEGRFIGNVAIFLEAGNETDFYDFLDLYIRRWKKEEKRVHDECHRKLSSEVTPTNIRRTLIASRGFNDNIQQFRRPFTPYDWLKRVETEYYFRYEGSQTVPPCFSQSVHWRVMKNSIRVSPVQIQQLEDLIANRLNPISCLIDTAGKSRSSNNKKVNVNRPIQSISPAHKLVFCECINWVSNISKDVAWCNSTMMQRGVLPLVKNKPNK